MRPRRDAGQVLGIDVGYSRRRKTTGFCALSWDRRTVRWTCRNAGTGAGVRREVLDTVLPEPGPDLLAVAIDGPLLPQLRVGSRYRCAESLLSRGRFGHRGKPGPSNGGSGRDLHKHATLLAHFILGERHVRVAAHVPAIHGRSIVEAFPTLFLGVLCDEVDYPARARRKRKWTDTLYPATQGTLGTLLQRLLPGRRVDGDLHITDHEKIASFVCALTALCVARNRFVAVGAQGDGFILLPPHELWGASAQSEIPWAARELCANVGRVAGVLPGRAPVVYRDGTRWMG